MGADEPLMRAWTVHEFGVYRDKLHLESVNRPEPEGASALIRVEAAGVQFADILNIAGEYQMKPPLPFTPGMEGAGVVESAGADSRYKPGDRVVALNLYGSHAEYMVALDEFSFPIPDAMSSAEAAAFTILYQTGYFALIHRARLQSGEILLVHGGAGAVGTAAIQLGKAFGATVIATAGSEDKLAVCRECGADHVINYRDADFVAEVKSITQGQGADVVYDPVGGDVFDGSTRCIAFEGRIVSVGFAGGRRPEVAVNRLLVKNFDVIGLNWGNYQLRKPELIRETQKILYDLFEAGKIKPVIYREYPMDGLIEALAAIESRASYGKVILAP
jgi:NADPH:quinone reductase